MDEQRPEPLPEEPTVQGGAALRELAARLLAPPDPYDETMAPPRILVGRLPEDLPVEVPIPNGLTVVGGMVRDMPRRNGRMVEVVLDAGVPAEQFRETYRQLLLTSGWDEDQERPGRSGFVPRGLPGLFHRAATRSSRLRRRLRGRVPGFPNFLDVFHLGDRGPRLILTVADRKDAPTDVRLQLITGGRRGPRDRHDLAWEIIPLLLPHPRARLLRDDNSTGVLGPPPGARERRGGGGGGQEPDSAYSNAVIETDLDLTTVAAHYVAQLEEAGWSRTNSGQEGPQAWSAWTFTDTENRPWIGAFTVLWLQGASKRHFLHIRADRVPDR